MARYRIRYCPKSNLLATRSLDRTAPSAADLVMSIKEEVGDLYVLHLEEATESLIEEAVPACVHR